MAYSVYVDPGYFNGHVYSNSPVTRTGLKCGRLDALLDTGRPLLQLMWGSTC